MVREHALNYVTNLGGWVCNCSRYFDDEIQLARHIQEEAEKELVIARLQTLPSNIRISIG